jgi:hypothetical protein
MTERDFSVEVAPTNGRPQRLVNIIHRTRGQHRAKIDTNSVPSRTRLIAEVARKFGTTPEDLAWLDDELVEAADQADRRADEAAGAGDEGERKSTADLLVELALARYRIARTQTDEPFAVEHGGPNTALMFRGSRHALCSTLARHYRELNGRTPTSTALADAMTVLEGEALTAEPEPVHLRVAEHDGQIILDLGDISGRAIVLEPGQWHVAERSPVVFRRTAATGALPLPERGGDLTELRAMLNVTDESWPLVVGWLVAALVPNIPHPILLLGGQQGTGKTTTAEQLVGLIDPSPALLRSPPRDLDAWCVSAAASWIVPIDNVSRITDWWSDALCRAVTGDGWLRRKLYTDDELAVLAFRRVVLLTSIDPGALRGDLGDRVLLVDLEPMAEIVRRTTRAIKERFRAARPRLLGALLNLVAEAWRELPRVELPAAPRMADFAQVLAAVDQVLPGQNALNIYVGQRQRIAETVIEGDPVAVAIRAMLEIEGAWQGTAGDLLTRLTPDKPPKDWPRTPQGIGGRLKRLVPALEQIGIHIGFGWSGRGNHRKRIITITQTEGETNVPIVPNVPGATPCGPNAGTTGNNGNDCWPFFVPNVPGATPCGPNAGTTGNNGNDLCPFSSTKPRTAHQTNPDGLWADDPAS